MMHTSAMVPPYGPAGTSRAFPQRIAGTLVGQEHAPTPDPCPLVHTPVVVCKVSGPPVLCYASHWLWGPRCSATHTSRGYSRRALLALGLRWLSCIPCPRPILQNCRHHETHNLSHHGPLFEIIRTLVAINSCTSPRSHIGTSSVPPPTTMGADPVSAYFFWC